MPEDTASRQPKRKRLWLALALLLLLAAILIVPPFLSVNHYRSQITRLMSASLGHPVRLASVGVRLLPWPAFVLTDLTVEEDPAYGAEPILHANTVAANIRLLSLWRGRLEISSVNVDEASLNLVRTAQGRWNFGSLFRTVAAPKAEPGAAPRPPRPLPSIEATNSRINIKNGDEKLPFSLLSTDLSFWQQDPNSWGLRLRGQPARTDVALDLADTGFVRLEARFARAPRLGQMPVHLDLDWRQAQLGQLSRLLLGSDPGWRGNLTGELHLDGTTESAKVQTRLSAEGVHRAEFAPAEPLDFDANCSLVYHYTARSVENLACDSPLGNGHIHLAGDLPADDASPRLSVELARIPVQAALDLLRTVRSGFGADLEVRGSVSGKLSYAQNSAPPPTRRPGTVHRAKNHTPPPGPLSGSLVVDGFQLSGDPLSSPITLPRTVFEPVSAAAGQPQALAATVAIPAGAGPLTLTARLALSGFQLTFRGEAAIPRARELAQLASPRDASLLDSLSGAPMTLDLSAEGPWLPVPGTAYSNVPFTAAPSSTVSRNSAAGRISGTLLFHNARWQAAFLANPVQIAQATLHLDPGEVRWDPVDFAYGPVKGSATLLLPQDCAAPDPCLPQFNLQFADLDAEALQAAVLGARERGTLLSTLLARLRPSSAPSWPQAEGQIAAASLLLGPVTLENLTASLRITATGAEIDGLDASLLGGHLHATGTMQNGNKPAYTLNADLQKLSPPAVGKLLGLRATGSAFDAGGKIELSGFTADDLAASATGSLHFEWRHGSIAPLSAHGADAVPAALSRFDRWTGDASIAHGAVTIRQDLVQYGRRKHAVEASLPLATPLKLQFAKDPASKHP